MDYLFFDMECADGNRACSFGYVLANEKFEILEKRDLLINPECKFRLGRSGEEPYIRLSYKEDEFRKAPNFAKVYDKIRALLTAENRILLGHSISSDIGFLEKACSRYSKEYFTFEVYDTQKIYSLCARERQMRSLEYIVSELGIDASHLTEHKSCDDAEMTMLVAKALTKRCECGIEELLQTNCASTVSSASLAINRAVKELKACYPKRKKAPAICISDAIKELDATKRINLLKTIFARGFGYSSTVQKCAYYVSNGQFGAKEQAYEECFAEGQTIRKITPAELGELLKISVSELCETDFEPLSNNAGKSAKAAFGAIASKRKTTKQAR